MLSQITPLILTRNEAPNIGATLGRLDWADEIVVVDSFSTDETAEIIARFANVRLVRRTFDLHASQWNFGLHEAGIATPWVLALDADYVVDDAFRSELAGLQPRPDVGGYEAAFRYCIEGVPLRRAVYPPVTVLFRREGATYRQDGHTQRVVVRGRTLRFASTLLHDDRKPLTDWVASQARYMRLEADKLAAADMASLGWPDRVRRLRIVAPIAMLLHCLFVRGLVLEGRRGLYYAFQRTFAELLLSLQLLERDLRRGK